VEGTIEVDGVNLWYRVSGDGPPVVQIHGAGFGHYNFDPATPELAKRFKVIDYDMRGYGASDRPVQHYDMEVWADDLAGLMDGLGIDAAHVHGTSMGGMIAIVFAGKYPERTRSVVINCAAAKLGPSGRLIFKNWIDIARLDPDGPGSRVLAELITWQALSRRFLAEQDAVALADRIQEILRDSNRIEVFTAGRVLQLDNFRKLAGFSWPGFRKENLRRQNKGQAQCAAAFLQSVQSGAPAIPPEQLFEVARVTIDAAEMLRSQQ